MIINSENIGVLNTNFSANFDKSFEEVKSDWPKIATRASSKVTATAYGLMDAFPNMREWLGDRQVENLKKYTLRDEVFESTIAVQRADIENDRYDMYNPDFMELGHSAGVHLDKVIFAFLKNGFDANCYDGGPFFSNVHAVGDRMVSNMHNGSNHAWFLLDTSHLLKPLVFQEWMVPKLFAKNDARSDSVLRPKAYRWGVRSQCRVGFAFWQMAFGSKMPLTKENFRAARNEMMSLKSDKGRPLDIKPTLLVVSTANGNVAWNLIMVERDENGAINTDHGVVEVLRAPWLP